MTTRNTTNALQEGTGLCEGCSGCTEGVSGDQEGREERKACSLNQRLMEGQHPRCKGYRHLYL